MRALLVLSQLSFCDCNIDAILVIRLGASVSWQRDVDVVQCSSRGASAAFWALEVMGQNIMQCFISKIRNVGAGVPTEKLWMRDAVHRLGVLILFIFQMSLQDLEIHWRQSKVFPGI